MHIWTARAVYPSELKIWPTGGIFGALNPPVGQILSRLGYRTRVSKETYYSLVQMESFLPTRLSESVLWGLQRDAYFEFGIESWTQKGVPFHITNNSLIARQYAEAVFPFFEKGPVTFLEVGAGSGKFAYLFLSELLEMGVQESSIRYLLTDFAEKNVFFCQKHPLFIPLIEKGMVVPFVYDPLAFQPLQLRPSVVIANYFFDTIPQDLFRKNDRQIEEGLVSVRLKEDPSLCRPIEKLVLDYRYEPIALNNFSYFNSDELDSLLRLYAQQVQDGPFLFPSSGIKALGNLAAVCEPGFTLLTADWRDAAGSPLQINLHGTFSFPVDFQALAPFFIQRGGEAFINSQGSSRFSAALFSTGKIPETAALIFKQQYFVPLEKRGASFASLLESLSQANWDATLFFSCFDSLEELFKGAAEDKKWVFIEGCLKIRSRFYPLFREESMLLDRLGLFLDGIEQKKEAEELFAAAKLFGCMPENQTDLSVLQIGQSHSRVFPSQPNVTLIPLDLAALEPLGSFDLILFFPQHLEKPEGPKIGLLREIEEQFPQLKEVVYTDADLHAFLAQIDISHPKYVVDFFLKLQRGSQISSAQLEMVFDRLEKEQALSSADRAKLASHQDGGDYFEILLSALKYHMKKGGVLQAAFPFSFQEERFFNEIVVNPYLDYKEEVRCCPSGEKFLWITLVKA